MAIPREGDLVPFGPFPRGANNLAREDSVPTGACREALNVDFYPGGKSRRRKGNTSLLDTPTANLWSDGDYALATSLDSQTLYFFDPDIGLTEIFSGFRQDSDVVYSAVAHLVYVSDGQTAMRVDTSDNAVRPWGVPRPAGQPKLTAVDGGLPPGKYQATTTYVTADGEESGADVASTIELTVQGGIRIQAAAFPVPLAVVAIQVYVTRQGGEELLKLGKYPVGALDVIYSAQRLGRPLYTALADVLPAGSLVAFVGGRLFVAVDNFLFFSLPNYYGLTDYENNYVQFIGNIDMIAAAQPGAATTGIFVCAGRKTYFLEMQDGNISNATNRIVYHAGGVRGMPAYIDGAALAMQGVPAQPLPMWLANNGQPCVGLPSGDVIALTNARYQMDIGERFSIAQRELEGINQAVIAVRGPQTSSSARAIDSAEVYLVKNGIGP